VHHVAKAFGIHLKGDVATNEISTAKYTMLTFLPVNLFEQFLRVANMYFLLMVILQLIPGLSPTSLFTTVAPLVFVLAVNAIKEGYDDVQRHRCAGLSLPAVPGSGRSPAAAEEAGAACCRSRSMQHMLKHGEVVLSCAAQSPVQLSQRKQSCSMQAAAS
jgi:hypothetical protein